ncbi:hypothetical protein BBP40_008431 [Aspergillus hancockii]|nr:hypothetical protein BBP40_008431 [Aspergillus hancockii]
MSSPYTRAVRASHHGQLEDDNYADDRTPLIQNNVEIRTFLRRKLAPDSEFVRTIQSREKRARLVGHATDWLASILLLSQTFISAVLAALGAMEKGSMAVIVLSLINALCATTISLLKGQELPQRYFRYMTGLAAILREVERLNDAMAAGCEVAWDDWMDLHSMNDTVERKHDADKPDVLAQLPGLNQLRGVRTTYDNFDRGWG